MVGGLPDPLTVGARDGSIGSLTVGAGVSVEFLGPSPNRVALFLNGTNLGNLTFNNRPIASATDGYIWQSDQTYLYLTKEVVGMLVAKPWFVFAAVASTVNWVEVLEG